jgi:hypothetical protein
MAGDSFNFQFRRSLIQEHAYCIRGSDNCDVGPAIAIEISDGDGSARRSCSSRLDGDRNTESKRTIAITWERLKKTSAANNQIHFAVAIEVATF